MSSSNSSTFKLESADGQVVALEMEMAKMYLGITKMMDEFSESEEGSTGDVPIVVGNVRGVILDKCVEWCEYSYYRFTTDDNDDEEVAAWNTWFLSVDILTLYDITVAANFLDIGGLVEICTKAVANLFKGKSSKDLRELLGLDCEDWKSEIYGEILREGDAVKLTRLLPEEVWAMVLDNMEKADLFSCTNCSLFFRELRKARRTVDLFAKAFQVMTMYEESKSVEMPRPVNPEVDIGVEQEHEHSESCKEDWTMTTLKCRLVCTSWNKVIEEWFQTPTLTGRLANLDELDPRIKIKNMRLPLTKYKFSYSEGLAKPQKFLQHFEQSHGMMKGGPARNPFLGRRVELELCLWPRHVKESGRARAEFLSAVMKMLECYGCEILELDMRVVLMEKDFDLLASSLQRFLGLVCNLKYLSLEQQGYSTAYVPSTMFAKYALPMLHKLEMLSLRNVMEPVAIELIQRNGHVVKCLSTLNCNFDADNGRFLNKLERFSCLNSTGGEGILATFGHGWNLKKLEIGVGSFATRKNVFSLLHGDWAATLTDVRLKFPFTNDATTARLESKYRRMNFPNIRRLVINSRHAFFLDFVLPTKSSLEHLEFGGNAVNEQHKNRIISEQTIELFGFEENMHQSNIWKLFPKLKTIKVWTSMLKYVVHTRKGEKLKHILCMQ